MDNTYPGIERVPVVFVNAYMVDVDSEDLSRGWVLIDTGLPGIGATLIQRAAAARYGAGVPPKAIVLTHGHFDHAGSARALAQKWRVPVYAHTLELPYLTGQSPYPPADPTVGGALAMLSRTFPTGPIDLTDHVVALTSDRLPALPAWRVIHTPGHTAGHISLFREDDSVLLAGDALATMNQDLWTTMVTMPKELRRPPAPLTTDWYAAMESVQLLATLDPWMIAAGHGLPILDVDADALLRDFADRMVPPLRGRYVDRAAITGPEGVITIPPPPPDPVGTALRAAAIGAIAGAIMVSARAGGSARRSAPSRT
jgi:glyoxylase-like metal-dependent hydrolase (beta-lactamase superfamily II)